MKDAVRWVVLVVAAVLIVGMLGWARGQDHHRGDEVGSLRPVGAGESVTPLATRPVPAAVSGADTHG